MALFRKAGVKLFRTATAPIARLFGAKPVADQPEVRAIQDARALEVARERERRAAREVADVQQQIEQLSERGRRAASQRAALQEAERIRQQVMELSRRERMAKAEHARAKADAEAIETRMRVWERLQTQEREEKQKERNVYYPNLKEEGKGGLPDLPAFLRGVQYSRFASSNVMALVYDPRHSHLYVQFIQRERWYRYYGVTKDEAITFFSRASKGETVWDLLRVRGTRTGHKKRFDRDASPPSDLPLPPESSASQLARGR